MRFPAALRMAPTKTQVFFSQFMIVREKKILEQPRIFQRTLSNNNSKKL